MNSTRSRFAWPMTVAALALMAGACDDTTGPEIPGQTVAIRFGTPSTASGSVTPTASSGAVSSPLADELALEGTNGTLTIADVRLIVAEFELDREGVDCDDAADEDACEKFEAPPSFVDLPLAGGTALVVEQSVPAGDYKELEFEVEDLEDDEEDAELRQQIEELRQAILAEFPDWPEKASVLVTGEFTPTDGSPTPFRAYFEAEIEVERHFEPPLVIAEDDTGPAVTVRIDPATWFGMPDGTVLDLTRYDYDSTGEVAEFELEFEDGVMELEWDD